MTAWSALLFGAACGVCGGGAILYGGDAWLHGLVAAMTGLCWTTRHHAYDGVVHLICAVSLSGGTLAFATSGVLSAAAGMAEAALLISGCGVLSGMAASTQMRPAGRFMSEVAGFVRARMA